MKTWYHDAITKLQPHGKELDLHIGAPYIFQKSIWVEATTNYILTDRIRSEISKHFGQMMQMFLSQMNLQLQAPEYVTQPAVMPCRTRPLEQQQWTNLPFGHLSFTGQQQMMPTVGASSSHPWQQAFSSSMPTFPSVSTATPPIDRSTNVSFPNSIPLQVVLHVLLRRTILQVLTNQHSALFTCIIMLYLWLYILFVLRISYDLEQCQILFN
ncbi:hypothetical protein Tsubulata_009153 [Turnera subulata]|uniref:Uncharacterized protein n=1 Tax=Turnera subulata TaxID=218843 RepID=A0A9Q0FIC7_9ROSI|nr:hypothetical protein Tsubulata_009153 [Turnera subulata]